MKLSQLAAVIGVLTAGCLAAGARQQSLAAPVTPAVKSAVQPEVNRQLGDMAPKALTAAGNIDRYTSRFRLPLRMLTAKDPWAGMAQGEQYGLAVARAATASQPVPGTLDALAAGLGRPSGTPRKVTLSARSVADGVATIRRVLTEAEAQRQATLAQLSDGNRKFIFEQTDPLVRNYGPQIGCNTVEQIQTLQHATSVLNFVHQRYDWPQLLGTAKTLARLSDAAFLRDLRAAFAGATPVPCALPGMVHGDLLYAEATPQGWVLIGGTGDNTYVLLDQPVAAIIDLGGNDTYIGYIAASRDRHHANSIVIDLAGNDRYTNRFTSDNKEVTVPFALATGRLGVGMLFDLAGDDEYLMDTGSGGAGFAGIGVLCDMAGNDKYLGAAYTQGVAIGGIGLLLDRAGNDVYTSHIYALGLGGCLGAGAVVDLAGDDRYQCGKTYASGYNATDCPSNDPKDPNFQYDAWGMGVGLGRRIYPFPQEHQVEHLVNQLAGGLGMLIDVAGNDAYDSSNFSQGCGYFFGVGVKLDLAGDDLHSGARYSVGSGAHQAMGLAIDYAGNDRYTTTGPTYFAGCAWDHSAVLCVDAAGNDRYDATRSSGFGLGDIGSWGVFADLGGNDAYQTRHGLGRASETGIGVFYEAGGHDDYSKAPKYGKQQLIPARGAILTDGEGGLFIGGKR